MKKPFCRRAFSRWPFTGHPPAINALLKLSLIYGKSQEKLQYIYEKILAFTKDIRFMDESESKNENRTGQKSGGLILSF